MAWRATLLVVAVTAASAIAAPAPAPSPSDLAAEAALIGDLARHFQIDAVCLVREEPLNASRHVHLATLQKELSKRSVRNHVASMEDFYKKRMKLKHYLFRTLYVITLPDKTGQNFLVETSRSRKWALSRMFMVLLNINRKGGLARGNVWLVLLRARPAVEPRTFLRRVRLTAETQLLLALPADTSGARQLLEAYRAGPRNDLRLEPFGRWPLAPGVPWAPANLWARRPPHLEGVTLKGVIDQHPPYTTWRKVGNKTEIGGLIGEIWTTLEKFLNFRTNLTCLKTTHVIQMSYCTFNNSCDAIIRDMGWNVQNNLLLHIASPFFTSRTGVFIKHPGFGYAGWWGLLKPFWVDFWLAAVVCVVAVAATLAVATLAAPGVPTPGAADALRCFLDFLFRTVAIFCGQGQERLPTANAARVAFAVASLAAIAVSAAYTSALYSNLAVQRERLLFTDIEGMRLTGFRMFFFSDSDTRIMWEHSNAPIRWQFGYSFQYSKGQKDFDEQVCKRDNRGLLELEDNVAMKLRMSPNCHLYRIDGFNMPTPVVMGFSPWFTYVPLFNKRIREMTRVGVVRRLRERPPPVVRLRPEQGDSVALATVLPVLCVLALGALLAAAALAAEVVLWRVRAPQRRLRRHAADPDADPNPDSCPPAPAPAGDASDGNI